MVLRGKLPCVSDGGRQSRCKSEYATNTRHQCCPMASAFRMRYSSRPRCILPGSLPCLRPAHHIDSKGLRSGIDLRRIPHKMLEPLASHKEEPDAWILSVSKPGLNYQNSG